MNTGQLQEISIYSCLRFSFQHGFDGGGKTRVNKDFNLWNEIWFCFSFVSRIPDLGYDFEKNEGKPFCYFSYGVACSEVEIDCLTGDHKVRGSSVK